MATRITSSGIQLESSIDKKQRISSLGISVEWEEQLANALLSSIGICIEFVPRHRYQIRTVTVYS